MQKVLGVPTIYFTLSVVDDTIKFITARQYDAYLAHHPIALKVGYINDMRLLIWYEHDIISIDMPQLNTLLTAFQSLDNNNINEVKKNE